MHGCITRNAVLLALALVVVLSRTDYGQAARITVQNQGECAGLNWSGSLPGRWWEISRPGCGATW